MALNFHQLTIPFHGQAHDARQAALRPQRLLFCLCVVFLFFFGTTAAYAEEVCHIIQQDGKSYKYCSNSIACKGVTKTNIGYYDICTANAKKNPKTGRYVVNEQTQTIETDSSRPEYCNDFVSLAGPKVYACYMLGKTCAKSPDDPLCKQQVDCNDNSKRNRIYCAGFFEKQPEKLDQVNTSPEANNGKIAGAAQAAQGRKKEFVFLGLDLQGLTSCLSCDIVEKLTQTAYDLGGQAYEILKTGVTLFLAAVFGIYILLQAGKLLFPFGPLESASGIFNSVMTRTFVIIAAMTFLTSFGNYWNLIHTPPLASAINLTSALMDKTKSALVGTALIKESCPTVDSADANAIGKAMSCTMRNAQNTVLHGLIAGITAMLSSAQTNNPLILFTSAAAGVIITFFGGLFLLWIYAPIYFSMPLKMADIILRWTLLAVLSPLVIAAAVFPATRSFVVAALKGLLQVAFELFMYGIVVAFGAYAMNAVIASLPSNNTGSGLFIDFTSNQGVYSSLITSAMFWQFLLIGYIMNTLLAKSRGVAIALSDPTPNPSGMHAAAFDELGQKAAERINNLGAKGFNWASGVWKSRMS